MQRDLTDQKAEGLTRDAGVDQNPAELHQVTVVDVIGPLQPQVHILHKQE